MVIQAILIRTVHVAIRLIQVPTKELGAQQVPAPGAWRSTVLRPTQPPGATQVGQWIVQKLSRSRSSRHMSNQKCQVCRRYPLHVCRSLQSLQVELSKSCLAVCLQSQSVVGDRRVW